MNAFSLSLFYANRLGNRLTVRHTIPSPVPDQSLMSRLVTARVDLPAAQRLLDQHYKLAVIKRCCEDQLRLRRKSTECTLPRPTPFSSDDDFQDDGELLLACMILQRQIDLIQGKKENIIVPSAKMRLIRERVQTSEPSTSPMENDDTQQVPLQSTPVKALASTTSEDPPTNPSILPEHPCIICRVEEKRLACIPCGHFVACVSCSHSFRTCPVCRRGIEAFVRIYV